MVALSISPYEIYGKEPIGIDPDCGFIFPFLFIFMQIYNASKSSTTNRKPTPLAVAAMITLDGIFPPPFGLEIEQIGKFSFEMPPHILSFPMTEIPLAFKKTS